MMGLSLAFGIDDTGPVFPMVTIISKVPPVVTIPELDGRTLIKGLACPNVLNVAKQIIIKTRGNCIKIFVEI